MKKHKNNNTESNFYEALFIASILLTIILATNSSEDYRVAKIIDTESGSGEIVIETTPHLLSKTERKKRSYGFILRRRSIQKELFAFKKADKERRKKRDKHRKSCRIEYRMANRDTKIPIILRCYRTQLTLSLESLRKERSLISNFPGISDIAMNNMLNSIDNLTEAITTVIDAIDSGVYSSKNSLEETKRNLAKKYWTPYWNSTIAFQTDYMLTWTAHLIEKIDKLDKTTISSEDEKLVINARECLKATMLEVQAVSKLDDIQNKFKECINIIK